MANRRLQAYKDLILSKTLTVYFQPGDGYVYELYINENAKVTYDRSKPLKPYQMKPHCVLV